MISGTNAPNFLTVFCIWASSEVLIARGPSIPEPLLRIYFSDLSLSFTSNFQISFDAPPVKGSRFMISPLMDSLSSFLIKDCLTLGSFSPLSLHLFHQNPIPPHYFDNFLRFFWQQIEHEPHLGHHKFSLL